MSSTADRIEVLCRQWDLTEFFNCITLRVYAELSIAVEPTRINVAILNFDKWMKLSTLNLNHSLIWIYFDLLEFIGAVNTFDAKLAAAVVTDGPDGACLIENEGVRLTTGNLVGVPQLLRHHHPPRCQHHLPIYINAIFTKLMLLIESPAIQLILDICLFGHVCRLVWLLLDEAVGTIGACTFWHLLWTEVVLL